MKTYSNKSNAKRASKSVVGEHEIVQVEGGWAIKLLEVEPVSIVEENNAETLDEEENSLIKDYGTTNCPHCSVHLSNGVGTHLQDVNGTRIKHDQFIFCCLGCDGEFGEAIPKVSKKGTTINNGLKIEKNREEKNGVKRPSVGGLCRAVWDECDTYLAQHGVSPKPSNLKEKAIAEGWNLNNVSIELYQWRKFNSISGR